MKYLIFLFFTTSLIAQKIDIDLVKLNTELTSIINNHRKSKKLNSLEKNKMLEKAALDQSEYVLLNHKLTHEQNIDNKKPLQPFNNCKVQKRVLMFIVVVDLLRNHQREFS